MVALPEAARKLLAFEPPETVVEVWRGSHRLGGRVVPRDVSGYLVLTTRRVAFVQTIGIGPRRTFHLLPRLVFPLEGITELREDPPGRLRVSDAEFRLTGPTAFAAHDLIERCRVDRLGELHAATPNGPGHAVVTERIIIREIVKVPCRYCGALSPQGANRCEVCGAPASR